MKKIIFAAAALLIFTAFANTAMAAWVMVPEDGYGCPPDYEFVAIKAEGGVVDACVPSDIGTEASSAKKLPAASTVDGSEA